MTIRSTPSRRRRGPRPVRSVRAAATTVLGSLGAIVAIGATTAALAATSPARAEAVPPERLGELEALRDRIEAAKDAGDELRRELRDLRETTRAEAVSDRRAAAIREMVAEVAADADSRASLLSSGYAAGWDGGFFLADPDGRFRLNIGAHAQFRWLINKIERDDNDSTRNGFEQTRTRLILSGHVFTPDLQFLVQVDPTRNERFDQQRNPQGDTSANLPTGLYYLEDAWVRYRIARDWYIRAGQFKLPFNREELVDPSRQLAVERSLINESLNIGRSQGIEIQWRGETDRFDFAVHDGATDDIGGTERLGLVDAEPRINSPALRPDAEWAFAGRWESLLAGSWRQFDDFTSPPGDEFGLLWGFGAHAYKTEATGVATPGRRDERRWYGATTDISAEFGGANLFGSVIYQYVDGNQQFEFYGTVGQGGWFIHPDHELFGRVEWGQTEGAVQADLLVFTTGWNWYIDGHDLKFSADFGFANSIVDLVWTSENAGFRRDFRGDENQWVLRTQFQLIF